MRSIADSDDRLYAIRNNSGRWTASAVAAGLALPVDLCAGVEAWEEVLDRLDEAIEAELSRM